MSTTGAEAEVLRHPLVQRLTHWLFVVAVLIMIGSGWRIYNDVPILPFRFPPWAALGGDSNYSYDQHGESGTANALLWHFAGMWLLVASLGIYALHGLFTGHFRRDFLPVRPRAFFADFVAAARFRLEHRLTLSLGALTMLTGCDISDGDAVQATLKAVSNWNDRVKAVLFGDNHLARIFPRSALSPNDRFNAYYGAGDAPKLDAASDQLSLAGAVANKQPWRVADFEELPQSSQITRHTCVEGWSYIGEWGGPTLGSFLHRVGADLTARYVGYECADGYYGGMDMPTALHPQTLIATHRRGGTLERQYGYPFKIRIPTKLGFKNPKFMTTLFFTNNRPGGFWEDRGYNWFSGS